MVSMHRKQIKDAAIDHPLGTPGTILPSIELSTAPSVGPAVQDRGVTSKQLRHQPDPSSRFRSFNITLHLIEDSNNEEPRSMLHYEPPNEFR